MMLAVDISHRFGDFVLEAKFASDRGVTALFGRSGSGKTSVVRILAGLTKPDRGRITLGSEVLTDTQAGILVPKHRRRFGYVFQEARLFPHLTVQQNLAYGRWFAPAADRSTSFAHIVDLLGIASLLDRRPSRLSGGERQRVAIGRALLSSPRLLLMDEPLAALDDPRKAEILPYLERLRDEMDVPIIYVSHSVAEVARLANRVVFMNDGKVEAIGPAIDVLSRPALLHGGDRRDAGAVVEGVVRGFDERHRLTTVGLKNATLSVPVAGLAPGRIVRVRIPARDVMLATTRPEGLSALNIMEGRVRRIQIDPDGTAEVQVDCGGDLVLALITALSCERLELAEGKPVFAVIKTVALES